MQKLSSKDRMTLMKFVCSFVWADLEVKDSEKRFVSTRVEDREEWRRPVILKTPNLVAAIVDAMQSRSLAVMPRATRRLLPRRWGIGRGLVRAEIARKVHPVDWFGGL